MIALGLVAACSFRAGGDLPSPSEPVTCPAEPPDDATEAAFDGRVPEGNEPVVRLRPATARGARGLVVNARVHPRGAPTRTWVEYWTDGGRHEQTTPKALPGKLTAHFHESWNDGPAGWESGIKSKALLGVAAGGVDGGYVRHVEPSDADPNHEDGIGTVHLTQYLHVGTYRYPANVHLGGGEPDFRDARVHLGVRGTAFKAEGTELVFWAQAHHDLKKQHTKQWRAANWAYTGSPLTGALASGAWTPVDVRLWNDASEWTYAGKSLAQHRDNYQYLPLDQTLASVNADVLHVLAFVNPVRPPSGEIAFDELDITYRNHSVLAASNGGRIVSAPSGAPDDAAALTDGFRHGDGHGWRSPPSPGGPVELLYELERPVTVHAVQVHQHLEWPARDVAVGVSPDGRTWTEVATFALPARAPLGPNYSFALKRDLSTTARFIKVTLRSGYRPEAWGLGEIEVFGDGAVERTDDDWYGVSVDLPALGGGASGGGTKVHYRVVASSVLGTVASETGTYSLAIDGRPVVHTLEASELTPTSAKVVARVAPLGRRAEAFVEFGETPRYGRRTPRAYVGFEDGPRSVFTALEGLAPATTYHYRVVGVTAVGVRCGADRTFTTK